jgi:hypothetical protein
MAGVLPGELVELALRPWGRPGPGRRFFLALPDGEPARACWATVFYDGVLLAAGVVAPRFRGRGVYRAPVAARLELARAVDVERLGFTVAGRSRLFTEAGA